MAEIVTVPLADLLVDERNARLKDEQPSQPSTMLAIARNQGSKLLKIAEDIVEKGLNPLALPGVVPTDDKKKRYRVIEGNRRITTLKGLETPSLVLPAFDTRGQRRFTELAKRFGKNPIEQVECRLFENEEALAHWVNLTHTGQNEGAGLVEWGSDEKDRFNARHGNRSPAGQILDFIDREGTLSPEAEASQKGIITSLQRLIHTPYVRKTLGIDVVNGEVMSFYPPDEVIKGLTKVVDDLKSGRIKVGDIYHAGQRIGYIDSFKKDQLPDPKKKLAAAVQLGAPGGAAAGGKSKIKPKPRARRKDRDRTSVIPRDVHLEIDPPRINQVYNELLTLSVEQFPNASAVLLRVFVELSVDHYIEQKKLMDDATLRASILAQKLKKAAADLKAKGKITSMLEDVVKKIANNKGVLAANLATFNQFVHNPYSLPKPTDLKLAWDELQPFMQALWP